MIKKLTDDAKFSQGEKVKLCDDETGEWVVEKVLWCVDLFATCDYVYVLRREGGYVRELAEEKYIESA